MVVLGLLVFLTPAASADSVSPVHEFQIRYAYGDTDPASGTWDMQVGTDLGLFVPPSLSDLGIYYIEMAGVTLHDSACEQTLPLLPDEYVPDEQFLGTGSGYADGSYDRVAMLSDVVIAGHSIQGVSGELALVGRWEDPEGTRSGVFLSHMFTGSWPTGCFSEGFDGYGFPLFFVEDPSGDVATVVEQVEDLVEQAPNPSDVIDDVLEIVDGIINGLPDPFDLLPPGIGHPSQACTGGVVVADGFAGDTYVKLRGDQSGDETRLCFRADNDQSGFGGRVDITDPQGAGAVDTTIGFACTSTPVLNGELGDPAEPTTHVPYTVAVDDASGETVLCVRVDDFERTITTSTSPDAAFEVLLDEPSTYATMSDWPAVPSAACADRGGERHVDVESFGTRVRLASYSSGTGQAQLCVRAGGPVPVGGVLTVDTTGAPGVEPVIETGSDRAACTLNVLSNTQPATVEITRSPAGDLPASVCVRAEGTVVRVTVGVTGDPTLPSVTWTPDPNTPG